LTARWLLAFAHLMGLGIGLGAVWTRARALAGPVDPAALRRALAADTWWGIAAVVWIATGLLRAFGPFEKGPAFYLHDGFFLLKMTFLLAILALEIAPMVALVRWRIELKRGLSPDTRRARAFARTSTVQAVLVVLMVLCATAMARGVRFPG
jgi:putative membrane protein